MLSVRPISSAPLSTVPAEDSLAVADPFAALLNEPEAQFIYLLRAYPFDDDAVRTIGILPAPISTLPISSIATLTAMGDITTVLLSDRGFQTGASDDPMHTEFPARLLQAMNYEARCADPANPSAGARAGFGAIRIANMDGEFDNYVGLRWDGRTVEVLAGGLDFRYADFAVVFRGITGPATWDEGEISLPLRDRQELFDRPLGGSLYDGTGGLNGGDDLKGRLRPNAYGLCRNASPVPVDAANLVYQVNDRAIQAVDEVRDSGVALTFDFDTTNIYGSAPASGKYSTDLSRGLIRLGSQPVGQVTADVRGDAQGGYVATAAGIAKRIATTRLGSDSLGDPSDIDGGAFAVLDAAFPAVCGLYVQGGEMTCAAALDLLLGSAGGWWTFTRQGLLTVSRLVAPASPVLAIDDTMIAENSFVLDALPLPSWRRRLGYRRNWTQQSRDQLAGSVTADAATEFANAERTVSATDEAVLTRHKLALDAAETTLIDDPADAATEVARREALHGPSREVYRLNVFGNLFRLKLGDAVSVTSVRFGLSAGKNFAVIGLAEDAALGEITLWLWG